MVPENTLYAYPLYFALELHILSHHFLIEYYRDFQLPPEEEREELIALINPYVIAKNPGKFKIIRGIGTTVVGKSPDMCLFFREGMDTFRKVLIDPSSSFLNLLAKIIIQEKFGMECEFIPAEPSFFFSGEGDAVVLTGDQALMWKNRGYRYFDLAEEWTDFTEKPFPMLVWAILSEGMNRSEQDVLIKARNLGVRYLSDIAETDKIYPELEWMDKYRFLTDHCRFELTDDDEEMIKLYWQYGFYYGDFDYIPELVFSVIEDE